MHHVRQHTHNPRHAPLPPVTRQWRNPHQVDWIEVQFAMARATKALILGVVVLIIGVLFVFTSVMSGMLKGDRL